MTHKSPASFEEKKIVLAPNHSEQHLKHTNTLTPRGEKGEQRAICLVVLN